MNNETSPEKPEKAEQEKPTTLSDLFVFPQTTALGRLWFLYTWPIKFLLCSLLPNPRVHRKLYPLTFIMCIGMIGANAYMVYWMVAIIGFTFGVPETVMGLTFLAGGGCLPEAISCFILIRRGE